MPTEDKCYTVIYTCYQHDNIFSSFYRLGGQCLPYEAGSEPGTDPNPCNQFYEVGVDRFYLPSGRAGNEPRILYNFAVDTRAIVDFLAPECQ